MWRLINRGIKAVDQVIVVIIGDFILVRNSTSSPKLKLQRIINSLPTRNQALQVLDRVRRAVAGHCPFSHSVHGLSLHCGEVVCIRERHIHFNVGSGSQRLPDFSRTLAMVDSFLRSYSCPEYAYYRFGFNTNSLDVVLVLIYQSPRHSNLAYLAR